MKAAVVGAGLAGRMLAWRLAEQGASVTLLDQHGRDKIDAGRIAAAMIAPSSEAVTTEALVRDIGEHSLSLWPQWLEQLSVDTGEEIAFQNRGSLLVAHPQDEGDWLRFTQRADAVLGSTRHLDQPALQKIEPELANRFRQAVYFPNEGVLNNLALYRALDSWFDHSQVDWKEHHSCNQLIDDGRVEGLTDTFDRVFDCRGNGARDAVRDLRSVRGEVLRVLAPEVGLSRPVRLLHPRYPLYIAPRPGDEYVIGATQIESELDHPVTVRSALELLSALYSLHEGFSEARVISMDVGLRPALPNNLPRINWGKKLVRFNGLYRHGYLFAPALVSDILTRLNDNEARFPELMVH